MLTPCIFKRGIVWIVFFAISLLLAPFLSEEEPVPQAPPAASVIVR